MKILKTKKLLAAFISAALGVSVLGMPGAVSAEMGETGDFNLDGVVNMADTIMMKEYLLGKFKNGYFISSRSMEAGDMNRDGKLNVFDLSILKNKIAEKYGDVKASVSLTKALKPYEISSAEPGDGFASAQTDFAVSLFKNVLSDDENTLVSPYSISSALAMTANGAGGVTKKEMEKVLFGGMDISGVNGQLADYIKNQPVESGCRLLTANSVWLNNDGRFKPSEDFLLTNKSYYNAEMFSAPFNSDGLGDVNLWVNKKTDGMIPELLQELDPDVVMMLVNAVTFDAKWSDNFKACWPDYMTFNCLDGSSVRCDCNIEGTAERYIKDDKAEGFLKDYKGGRYSFAVIMPDEGVSVLDYAKGLTGKKFSSLVKNAEKARVCITKMPKIETSFNASVKDALGAMGMKTAFDEQTANFSKMGRMINGERLRIDDVKHKTVICVDDKGTKAAAATVVSMINCTVTLGDYVFNVDRPFVYAIVDNETNIPVFLGTFLKAE